MKAVLQICTVVGSLAVFLYGMKLMSESLQKVAGDRMRSILASMTSNRAKGVLTGIIITALFQSSSASTVMVVSFVNAGLMRLTEAISVIMGANIGTTITAWIISIFGFKVQMASVTLPLLGLALPLLFSKKRSLKQYGEMIMGFALLFIGLDFLKNSVPDLESYEGALQFLSDFSNMGYWSYLFFLMIGTILTILIQSSSATMALTLVMCNNGWIGFDVAAAMVLGENIGTTITANMAAMVANSSAKQAARAHFMFNVLGVFWVMAIFPFFLDGVVWLHVKMGGTSPYENTASIPIALATFHTVFNIINTAGMLGFTRKIASIVQKLTPKSQQEEDYKLQHINIGLLSTPDASIFQATKEVVIFSEKMQRMFRKTIKLYNEKSEKKVLKYMQSIEKSEEYADRVEVEIANYLTKVGEGRLNPSNALKIRALYKMIDDIESIGDACLNIKSAVSRKRDQKVAFPEFVDNNINLMFEMVDDALDFMVKSLIDSDTVSLTTAQKKETEINNYRDILKNEHINNLESGKYQYDVGIIYNDIISQSERLADFVININESLSHIKSVEN